MNNELPCIRDKCLLYPSCRNKMMIGCDELYNLIQEAAIDYNCENLQDDYDKLLKQINEILPSLVRVNKVGDNSSFYYVYEMEWRWTQ